MKRRIVSLLCSLLAVCLSLLCVSCALTVRAEELSAGYTRSEEANAVLFHSEKPGPDALAPLADFSFDVLHTALGSADVTEDANPLFSPLSFLLCLGMISNGADGETRAALESAFGCDVDTLNATLAKTAYNLFSGESCRLETANSLWIKNGFDVKPAFLQNTADWYGAQVYCTPMNDQTTEDVNRWCDDRTDGMIRKILEEPLSSDTRMILINALVFDAKWSVPYEKDDVLDEPFTNADGSVTEVSMLSSVEGVWLENDDFIGTARAYKGGQYSFVGLLPRDASADVRAEAAKLTGSGWLDMWKNRGNASVDVWIPEFEGETKLDLREALTAMGITAPFDPEAADFSALSEIPTYVSALMQKTYISLDRNGTKAAAVTWGLNDECCMEIIDSREVHLDRPFLYLIIDNETGLPVFAGIVEKL